MRFLFGALDMESTALTADGARDVLIAARAASRVFPSIPISEILDVIDRIGPLWRPGAQAFEEALRVLPSETGFSEETIRMSLSLLPELCSRENLLARIRAEFGNEAILDRFVAREGFDGELRFFPYGILLHVTAGNVFLGAIDSILLGLVTKNVSIVKLSKTGRAFAGLFAKTLLEADPKRILASKLTLVYWPGGDDAVEQVFCKGVEGVNGVDAVLAFGGSEMIEAYRKNLPVETPLLAHGPKLSLQVVRKSALEMTSITEIASRSARDVIYWDQAACASPQNLFLEDGIDPKAFVQALADALGASGIPRGPIDGDEAVELLQEEHRGWMTSLQHGGCFQKGQDWMVHFDPRPGVRPSPLHRTLLVKPFRDLNDLEAQIAPARTSLQSAGILAHPREKAELLACLGAAGALRIAPLGEMMSGMTGAPHDGRYSLMELGKLVPDESKPGLVEFANAAIAKTPAYRDLYKGKPVHSAQDLIPLPSYTVPLPSTFRHAEGGYVFGSGGTTGNPKYVYFTDNEFHQTAALLAKGYRSQGIRPGDLCANLFVAGNLWSSFLAVDLALSICGAARLPIGGLADPALILDSLERFRPRAVFGLPSLLATLAARSAAEKRDLQVEFISYAGEHLSHPARVEIEKAWGTRSFYSAGYASVDAGPIGYTCLHTAPREHHVFEGSVHLEIAEGEGIVTSFVRTAMPVLHLRTGDHLEWTSAPNTLCACGSRERRFLLHGRVDGQMRVFSSRVSWEEIERAFALAGIDASVFQIALEDAPTEAHHERLTVRFESPVDPGAAGLERLRRAIHSACKDLSATHRFESLGAALQAECLAPGSLARVARTGKVRPILDGRRI